MNDKPVFVASNRYEDKMKNSVLKNCLLKEFGDGRKLFEIERPRSVTEDHVGKYYNARLVIRGEGERDIAAVIHVPKPRKTIDGKTTISDIWAIVGGSKSHVSDMLQLLAIEVGDELTREQIELLSSQLKSNF